MKIISIRYLNRLSINYIDEKKIVFILKHCGKGSYFIFMNNESSNVKHTQSYAYIFINPSSLFRILNLYTYPIVFDLNIK